MGQLFLCLYPALCCPYFESLPNLNVKLLPSNTLSLRHVKSMLMIKQINCDFSNLDFMRIFPFLENLFFTVQLKLLKSSNSEMLWPLYIYRQKRRKLEYVKEILPGLLFKSFKNLLMVDIIRINITRFFRRWSSMSPIQVFCFENSCFNCS